MARIEGEVRGLRAEHTGAVRTLEGEMRCAERPRTNRTRRVSHPVPIGHAASLTPYQSDTPRPSPRTNVRHLSADIEDVARELRARRALESAQVSHCPLPALLIKRL